MRELMPQNRRVVQRIAGGRHWKKPLNRFRLHSPAPVCFGAELTGCSVSRLDTPTGSRTPVRNENPTSWATRRWGMRSKLLISQQAVACQLASLLVGSYAMRRASMSQKGHLVNGNLLYAVCRKHSLEAARALAHQGGARFE